MKTNVCIAAAGAALMLAAAHAGPYAEAVVAYEPGTGYATEFGSGAGYTNASSALGVPSRVTIDTHPQFGGTFPVDPFSPPYLRSQLVSLGAGGSLTLRLGTPAVNDPAHPFGIDLLVFGNTAFVITNGDFTGGGITDGHLFGAHEGEGRVAVSADGITFYELAPPGPAAFDSYFPTDGAGDFTRAVDPQLTSSDFAGRTLTGIRELYAGSGGGAGFDLAWARDAEGRPVELDAARYVRFTVASGHAEIDAVAAVPPQGFGEHFARDPQERGWRSVGDSTLFAWDAAQQALRVTWDSSRTNSYYHRPLGTILSRNDDFSAAFTLQLESVEVGTTAGKPFAFQLALGFLNLRDAMAAGFRRGTGFDSPNLVEFTYFPDSGFGATVWPTVISTNAQLNYNGPEDYTILELTTGSVYRVELRYTAADQTLRTTLTRDGQPAGPVNAVRLAPGFTDFRVDTFAISSYSDAGSDGSVRAVGFVDDVEVVVPPAPVRSLQGTLVAGDWEARFEGRAGWQYRLERSTNLASWEAVSERTLDQAGEVLLRDDSPPAAGAVYRVRAEK